MSGEFFTPGGPVGAGVYIGRSADTELMELCSKSEYGFILTTRQVGKSSLMFRTAKILARQGIESVIIDLSRIGKEVTAQQWYLGIIHRIAQSLLPEFDVFEWWSANSSLGQTERFVLFFESVLLAKVEKQIVIFIDEIDTTLSLDFSDDFFIAVRHMYNSRANVPAFQRLSFVFVGVATPSDLIENPKRTPFNVGQRIDLTDFSFEEALPLADGLGLAPDDARQALRRVLRWTRGHPFLTQRLCRAIADRKKQTWAEDEIDRLVADTFFGEKSKNDSNLTAVRDLLTKRAPDSAAVLGTYRKLRRGWRTVLDEEQSLVKSHLKLSGVVRVDDGILHTRNRIYETVFDEKWIREHFPINWSKRLARLATLLIATLLVVSLPIAIIALISRQEALRQRDEASVQRQVAEGLRQEANVQREMALAKQTEAENERNIAEAQKEIAQHQTMIATNMKNLGELYRGIFTGETEEGSELVMAEIPETEFRKIMALYRKMGDHVGELSTVLRFADYLSGNSSDPKAALGYYEQALPLLKYVRDAQLKVFVFTKCGDLYGSIEDSNKALEFYGKALALSNVAADRAGLLKTMAEQSVAAKNKVSAITYYEEAARNYHKYNDIFNEINMVLEIAGLHGELGNKRLALKSFQAALPLFELIRKQDSQFTASSDGPSAFKPILIGGSPTNPRDVDREVDTLLAIGHLSNDFGDNQQAEDSYKKALQIYRQVHRSAEEARVLLDIARFYERTGQRKKAVDYYNLALPLIQDNANIRDKIRALTESQPDKN